LLPGDVATFRVETRQSFWVSFQKNYFLASKKETSMTAEEQIIQADDAGPEAVGPIIRSGEIAEAVIDAIAEDNPGRHVFVVDRGDYIRVHVDHHCVLRKATMEKHLGRAYELCRLEIEMPSFAGRIRTTVNEYTWYHGGIAA